MVRHFQLWATFLGASLAGQLSYRQSFVLETVGRFFLTLLELGGVLVLFDHVDGLAGWTKWEVAYLYGAASLALGIAEILTDGLRDMPELVRQGALDGILVRPVSPLIQVMGRQCRPFHLGRVLQGACILTAALVLQGWSPGFVEVAMILVTVLCTATVFSAVFLAGAATTIYTVQAAEAFNAFTYGGVNMAQFPLPIYPDWLRTLFVFVVPVGYTMYFPSLLVLGKPDALGFGPLAPWLAPLVAAGFLALALGWWAYALNHYRSTGS